MDDYMFNWHVEKTRVVHEANSYLEMFTYSDPKYNKPPDEHKLEDEDFENWIYQRGAFLPKPLPAGVTQTASFRLLIQQKVKHPETFAPNVISLPHHRYKTMVDVMRLPYRGIETTSAVGPIFWAAFDQDEDNPHLQIVYRKSDVRKKGLTRGWELMLSHDINNGNTTGFFKGTESSDLIACLTHLKCCVGQIGHPMLLPMIIFSHDMSSKTDIKQREAREWLRKLEHVVSMRTEINEDEGYVDKGGLVDFDLINRHLVECHSQVLWKRPKAYMEIANSFQDTMTAFKEKVPERRMDKNMRKLSASMDSRIEFYLKKLQGIDSYAHTTLQRLEIQRNALYNIIAVKESKLNFEMAGEQQKLAHISRRDNYAMKTFSLLGAIFLPGAFLASVFSTTFFNFQFSNDSAVVSEQFYIFWVTTLPITAIVVLGWYIWDKWRDRIHRKEDEDLEKAIEGMEHRITSSMRTKTMAKAQTWDKKQ